jgi:hypothetical protein
MSQLNNGNHPVAYHDAFADDADVHESAKIQVRAIWEYLALEANLLESDPGRLSESQVCRLFPWVVACRSLASNSFVDGKRQMSGILGGT